MAEEFRRAMRNPPEWSNADDPGADRLAAHDEGGELGTPQEGTMPVGAHAEHATDPGSPVSPAGKDADVLQVGGPGDRIAGPHATDKPGEPGLERRPSGGERPQPGSGEPEADDTQGWTQRLDP
jgi:hypothetical protein